MTKTHQIVGIEGTYLNIIKSLSDIPTATLNSMEKSCKHFF